jgi:hypothetical protein
MANPGFLIFDYYPFNSLVTYLMNMSLQAEMVPRTSHWGHSKTRHSPCQEPSCSQRQWALQCSVLSPSHGAHLQSSSTQQQLYSERETDVRHISIQVHGLYWILLSNYFDLM